MGHDLAGHSTLRDFLVLASALGTEPDPAAWSPVGGALVLTKRIAPPEEEDALHEAVAALLGPTHRRLGFDATPGEATAPRRCARSPST